nr:MAG TPA: hypothetical protein [Caudoviricetes sp.]
MMSGKKIIPSLTSFLFLQSIFHTVSIFFAGRLQQCLLSIHKNQTSVFSPRFFQKILHLNTKEFCHFLKFCTWNICCTIDPVIICFQSNTHFFCKHFFGHLLSDSFCLNVDKHIIAPYSTFGRVSGKKI